MGQSKASEYGRQCASSAATLKQGICFVSEEAEVRRLKEQLLQAKEATAQTFKPQQVRTPVPVEGRHHVQLQTDPLLIELTEKAHESMAETQTDPWIDRPDTPMFRPHREETHASTQIHDGDLFDFDEEVVPILEVIVGKILEQSFCEVMEEEELAAIREEQEKFEKLRTQEVIEYQRLAAAEKRRKEEMERRLAQTKAWQEAKRLASLKMLADDYGAVCRRGRSDLLLQQLAESTGLFIHPTVGAVSVKFWPALMDSALSKVSQRNNFTAFTVSTLLPAIDRPQAEKEQAIVFKKTSKEKRNLEVRLEQMRQKAETKARLAREETERQEMERADILEEERNFELAEAERLAQAEEASDADQPSKGQESLVVTDNEESVAIEAEKEDQARITEDEASEVAELEG